MQLKPVQIPTFSGDKRSYLSWKAAFMAFVDRAPVKQEYKMFQLWQYVSGEALTAIENLGSSPAAYEAAKDRLERKYGGKRRHKSQFYGRLGAVPADTVWKCWGSGTICGLVGYHNNKSQRSRQASRPLRWILVYSAAKETSPVSAGKIPRLAFRK